MERRAIDIYGTVQGVGFRPFVFGLATRMGLAGLVRNHSGGVCIEVEGETPALEHFLETLAKDAPPLARIERLSWAARSVVGESGFRIEMSDIGSTGDVVIAPDVATCEACLADLRNPRDRRFGYPFLNCTNCGPRLTIVTGAPYDRPRTTMAEFTMCPACRAEYENPRDRRFHAQPTACPQCGPRLELRSGCEAAAETDEPLAGFVKAISEGKIGAMKGLGGYHLICDATNAATVIELRRRKRRDEKPLAVMVENLRAAENLCEIGTEERELLTSWRRPIVLLRKRIGCSVVEDVAPGNPFLGVMLPYTPLHELLFEQMRGAVLVMTSGNVSDEPIAFETDDASERLAGVADVFLEHNRRIHVRCDDSVARVVGGRVSLLRRSRGYAPQPIATSFEFTEPILAVGGQLKATFALGQGRRATVSHHLGDLDHFEAYRAFERDVRLYEELFALRPEVIAHDLHPDYASTRYALDWEKRDGVRRIAVQHHHAHMASCLVDNAISGQVIGVIFDGTGFGLDGAVWGGEFLVGDTKEFRRAAHLRYVGVPGGDRAIREPWRMALSHTVDAQCSDKLPAGVQKTEAGIVRTMLERQINTPMTSSVGRLFDAVAAIAGVRDRGSFEGQAAMELEWLAYQSSDTTAYPYEIGADSDGARADDGLIVDTRALIRAVVDDVNRGVTRAIIARRFHTTMSWIIRDVCGAIRKSTGLNRVVLSGGVFMNALLAEEASTLLDSEGFTVYRHCLVPPNDGGLSLGQLAVAANQILPA